MATQQKKWWEKIGEKLGLGGGGSTLQASPISPEQQALKQQAPTAAPSGIGQALAQPVTAPMRRPDLPAEEIGVPTIPERLGGEAGMGRLEALRANPLTAVFGPASTMGKVGTALATDPTVQAQVGQLAMALGAKSPTGIGYQLGKSIVESAEGQQYRMLQEYFSDIISGREPRADFDIEDITLSPELTSKAFMGTLEGALGKARGEYYEAGAERQRAEAEVIRTRTPEVIAAEKAEEERLTEETRLGRQTESRRFALLKSKPGGLYDLMREKIASETGELFWQHMGIDRPPDIPVQWTDENKRDFRNIMDEMLTKHGVDFTTPGGIDDAASEGFLQEVIDAGIEAGLSPEEAENQAFEIYMMMKE